MVKNTVSKVMSDITWHRGLRLTERVIEQLSLDLSGKTILTEVGSNSFIYTPIIALKANAKKVYAWCKDTHYGNAHSIISECVELIKYAGLDETKISFDETGNNIEHLRSADIITNSGFIRPLNQEKLQFFKSDAVIPIMYESWELRSSDIDINYCKARNIKVAGTWENFPGLNIFDYCEQLILKIVFETGMEIKNNKILIWSNDHFGEMAERGFEKMGAATIIKTISISTLLENIDNCDFIFFCDYISEKVLIGENGLIDAEAIAKRNPSIVFIHLAGKIDPAFAPEGIKIYPNQKGHSHRMTYTLSYLGIDPVIKLLAAGLKVGELLSNNNHTDNKLVQLVN